MVTHLTEADRAARARPTSAAGVGAAGLAYHADMFYEQAERCYAIAEALSGDWRWTYLAALASSARGDAESLTRGLRRVVAEAPNFAPASWQLGEAAFKAARYEQAQEAWRRVLTLPATRSWDLPSAGLSGSRDPASAGFLSGSWDPASAGLSGAWDPALAGLSGSRDPALAGLSGSREPASARLSGSWDPASAGLSGSSDPALAGLSPKDQPRPRTPARTIDAPIAAYAELGLARIAIAQGDAEKARQQLEKLTETVPRFGPAHRLLGGVYASLNRPDDAKRAIRTADRLPNAPYVDPTVDTLVRESRSATFLLQQASMADLDTNAAWREYLVRRAVEFDPRNADALADLATMLRVLHRSEEALEVLERERRLVGDDPQVLAEMGRCLLGLQRYRDAEAILLRSLDAADDVNAHYLYGVVLDRLGRLPEAVLEFQRALDRHPTHKDALNDLGVALVRQGKLAQAIRVFERLVATDPDNADAHTNLGALLLSEHDQSRAEREFRLALEISPGHARAREGLMKLR